MWRLADDQVASARLVLKAAAGQAVEIIPVTQEDGISIIAFALKEPLDSYGAETAEIEMDSTCKSLAMTHFTLTAYLYAYREDECCIL